MLRCRAAQGVEAPEVTIEVLLSGGLPSFSIVGLAETAVRESKDRVRGALMSSGFDFPQRRITVSLGPADLRKTGGRFDLAIALGVLIAGGQIPGAEAHDTEFYGELGLNGELRAVPGILPAAIKAGEAGRSLLVPAANAAEAQLAATDVRVARTLLEAARYVNGAEPIAPLKRTGDVHGRRAAPDLADVRGQPRAKRALEIAAAGGHHLLLAGPPGTGKSMLAQRLPGILPAMSYSESLEVAAVESVLGAAFDITDFRAPRFRAPHHSASAAALAGGGSEPLPGEVSRAHNGVLFLDELPEWKRHVLETLREPLESGRICISRAGRQAEFPARFQFVAAMNPCPCGYLGDAAGECNCSRDKVAAYRNRISGPLFDRIDIRITVARPPVEALRPGGERPEASDVVRTRVATARKVQESRAGVCNALLDGDAFDEHCKTDEPGTRMLEAAMTRYAMSIRGQRRVLRVARTVADLSGDGRIRSSHVAEALSLRCSEATAKRTRQNIRSG